MKLALKNSSTKKLFAEYPNQKFVEIVGYLDKMLTLISELGSDEYTPKERKEIATNHHLRFFQNSMKCFCLDSKIYPLELIHAFQVIVERIKDVSLTAYNLNPDPEEIKAYVTRQAELNQKDWIPKNFYKRTSKKYNLSSWLYRIDKEGLSLFNKLKSIAKSVKLEPDYFLDLINNLSLRMYLDYHNSFP